MKKKVLDHGHVRLVDSMGGDLAVVRSARVSYDAAWRAGKDTGSDARLINYLLANGHTSPFESVLFTFDVKAPIFVFRQWHRHRTWKFNELSARYKELPEEFYVPAVGELKKQSKDNKQVRSSEQVEAAARSRSLIRQTNRQAFTSYRVLLNAGVARELARSVLPVGTYSQMFATVDLHNLMHFLKLRLHPHAQYEIRVYAEAMLALVRKVAPVSVEAFERIVMEGEK